MDDNEIADKLQLKLSEGDSGIYSRNKKYVKDSSSGYITKLSPDEQAGFLDWVKNNNVPYDPSPTADYDMPGFYKGLTSGDPRATTGINPNDGDLHFSDAWKTPYHKSFSNESQYATPDAPHWINDHQLADNKGNVIFDETQ